MPSLYSVPRLFKNAAHCAAARPSTSRRPSPFIRPGLSYGNTSLYPARTNIIKAGGELKRRNEVVDRSTIKRTARTPVDIRTPPAVSVELPRRSIPSNLGVRPGLRSSVRTPLSSLLCNGVYMMTPISSVWPSPISLKDLIGMRHPAYCAFSCSISSTEQRAMAQVRLLQCPVWI
jgi:hypothetical protein